MRNTHQEINNENIERKRTKLYVSKGDVKNCYKSIEIHEGLDKLFEFGNKVKE